MKESGDVHFWLWLFIAHIPVRNSFLLGDKRREQLCNATQHKKLKNYQASSDTPLYSIATATKQKQHNTFVTLFLSLSFSHRIATISVHLSIDGLHSWSKMICLNACLCMHAYMHTAQSSNNCFVLSLHQTLSAIIILFACRWSWVFSHFQCRRMRRLRCELPSQQESNVINGARFHNVAVYLYGCAVEPLVLRAGWYTCEQDIV